MFIYSTTFCLLACCLLGGASTSADANDDRVRQNPPLQHPPPHCNDSVFYGTGRATHNRFWYNARTGECEKFVWTGGVSEENNFGSVEECEETCDRGGAGPRTKLVTCSFFVNLGRECGINPLVDLKHIRLCQEEPVGRLNEEECLARGCCYERGFCYEKTNEFANAECSIRYTTETGFWGKINFQSDLAYSHGWVGSVKFNRPVGGDFCILKDSTDDVTLSGAVGNRTRFLLPGRSQLYPGQQVTILFEGTFSQSRTATQQCKYVSRPNNEIVISVP